MPSKPVVICGGGLVGLVLAHGLKNHGIPYSVYERDDEFATREQGWAITIHWSLAALDQMLPPDIFGQIDSTSVDPFHENDTGNFLVLDARNLDIFYKIPPNKRRVRANRAKLRALLLKGVNIKYGKKFSSYEVTSDGVTARFTDGTSVEGSLLVGCDGNNSAVRTQLLGADKAALNPIPVHMHGVTQVMTRAQIAPLRALDALLFQAINPETGFYLWHSIQDVTRGNGDNNEEIYDVQTMVSHLVKGPEDILPKRASDVEHIKDMKQRAAGNAEPLLSTVMNIPETAKVTCISLADWIPRPWNGQGRVSLAGDAAGPMTMYRGEGANHGFLDAACLASALVKVRKGMLTQEEALEAYEGEVRQRREIAIPLSREAALDAHMGIPPPESPLVGRRLAPPTSMRTFF